MKRLSLLVAACAACVGCQTMRNINIGPDGIGVREDPCKDLKAYDLTARQEYFFGRSATANLISKYGAEKVVPPQSPLARYVAKVGQTVAATAADRNGDAALLSRANNPRVHDRPWPLGGYHFIVVDHPTANAHGLPGGFVIVTTGLLSLAQSEEDLAGVLAHEVAHVQRGHGVEIVKLSLCNEAHKNDGLVGASRKALVSGVAAIADDDPLTRMLANEQVAGKLFDAALSSVYEKIESGYGADDEFEADRLGVSFAAWSGYGPEGLSSVLARLPKRTGKGVIFGASASHPPAEERLSRVAPEAKALPTATGGGKVRSARFQRELAGQLSKKS